MKNNILFSNFRRPTRPNINTNSTAFNPAKKARNTFTACIMICFLVLNGNAQELFTFPSASTSANYTDSNIDNITLLNPSTGITAAGCGTWLSATGYDETTMADAMAFGDYWEFTLELAAGKEVFITSISIKDVATNLPASSDSVQNFALAYKLGASGSWMTPIQLTPEKLGANLCSSGNSTYNFNTAFSSTEDVYFRLVAWGQEPVDVKFGEMTFSGVITDPLPSGPEILMLKQTGKVVIGDTAVISTPGAYGLYVQDGILTEAVKVALRNSTEWSDDEWTNTPSLDEVKRSIEENRHLPHMPSADQLVKEGYELKNMDALLLAQIEWLWQKVIELDKQLSEKN